MIIFGFIAVVLLLGLLAAWLSTYNRRATGFALIFGPEKPWKGEQVNTTKIHKGFSCKVTVIGKGPANEPEPLDFKTPLEFSTVEGTAFVFKDADDGDDQFTVGVDELGISNVGYKVDADMSDGVALIEGLFSVECIPVLASSVSELFSDEKPFVRPA